MDKMRVVYQGSISEFRGMEFDAQPCECAMCVFDGYSRGWMLTRKNWGDVALFNARDESIIVL